MTLKSQRAKWYRDRKKTVMNGYEEFMDSEQLIFICALYHNIWEQTVLKEILKEVNRD